MEERLAIRNAIETVIQSNGQEGPETNYPCPFCMRDGRAHVGTLHVNYRKGLAICHQCLYGTRNVLYLIRDLTGSIPRNLSRLRNIAVGDDIESFVRSTIYKTADAAAAATVSVTLPDSYRRLTRKPKDRLGKCVLEYLQGRDVDNLMLEEIGIGYGTEGKFRGYAIFPIHIFGELITFTSRRVVGTGPKALHAPASKSRMALFNYDTALAMRAKRVFIGEGPFDAWAFHRRADPKDAGVGLLGKVLHREQIRLLDRLPCEEFVVCLDDTEHAKTQEYASMLSRGTSKDVSFILLKEGSGDPHDNRERLPRYIDRRRPFNGLLSDVERLLA